MISELVFLRGACAKTRIPRGEDALFKVCIVSWGKIIWLQNTVIRQKFVTKIKNYRKNRHAIFMRISNWKIKKKRGKIQKARVNNTRYYNNCKYLQVRIQKYRNGTVITVNIYKLWSKNIKMVL